MDHESRQFVTRKEFQPFERKSTFHMKIENFKKFGSGEIIQSKKIHFIDGDDVWCISVKTGITNVVTVFLQTSDSIWMSRNWICSVTISANNTHLPPTKCKITQKQTQLSCEFRGSSSLELKITMTISLAETSTDKVSIHKFFDSTVQYKKILSNNKELLNEPKYSDFTFVVQAKRYKVHKNILAAASPVFDKLFTSNFHETATNECIVNHIEPTIFQHLLNFIYCGELPENLHEVARPLYEAAHYYQINELAEICISVERYHLSKDNAIEVYKWAETYNLETAKEDAWKIIKFEILENFDVIPPPSLQSVLSLVENKIEKEDVLQQCRRKLLEIENNREELLKLNG